MSLIKAQELQGTWVQLNTTICDEVFGFGKNKIFVTNYELNFYSI